MAYETTFFGKITILRRKRKSYVGFWVIGASCTNPVHGVPCTKKLVDYTLNSER